MAGNGQESDLSLVDVQLMSCEGEEAYRPFPFLLCIIRATSMYEKIEKKIGKKIDKAINFFFQFFFQLFFQFFYTWTYVLSLFLLLSIDFLRPFYM